MAKKFIRFADENSEVKLSHHVDYKTKYYKPRYVDVPFTYKPEFDVCRYCEIALEPDWSYCPMCGTEIGYVAKYYHQYR